MVSFILNYDKMTDGEYGAGNAFFSGTSDLVSFFIDFHGVCYLYFCLTLNPGFLGGGDCVVFLFPLL